MENMMLAFMIIRAASQSTSQEVVNEQVIMASDHSLFTFCLTAIKLLILELNLMKRKKLHDRLRFLYFLNQTHNSHGLRTF